MAAKSKAPPSALGAAQQLEDCIKDIKMTQDMLAEKEAKRAKLMSSLVQDDIEKFARAKISEQMTEHQRELRGIINDVQVQQKDHEDRIGASERL